MTNKLKLIGLHGPAGCGKDTIAEFLRDTQQFRQIALAAPIRNGISVMFGLPMEYLTDRKLKDEPIDLLCGHTPRHAMQTLGTEWGRNHICLDVWLKIAQREIDYQASLAAANNLFLNGIVVSDIRFEGEAKWLRDQGGTIWHIRRPNNPRELNTDHESEKSIVPLDGEPFLINDGDIEQLHDHIAELIETEETA